jgi:nucleoside-diphosphate-sugar epimerase
MRVFVTGASGFIGTAVIAELIDAGHQVVGLARSDNSADIVAATGAEVLRGGLDDLDSLKKGAAATDGVVHLAFKHDFSDYADAARSDRLAIDSFGDVLEGSDRPLVIASGTLGLTPGRLAAEHDGLEYSDSPAAGRLNNGVATLALAERGIRASVVRLAPSVHDDHKKGFVGNLVDFARGSGVSGYVGDGSQRWPAVHRLDAARLFRLALESAPVGSVLHAVADEGIALRTIAETIGKHLDLPVRSVAPEHFSWLGMLLSLDSPASSSVTRELFDWQPTHPGLLDDLDNGHWFEA